MEGGRFQPLHPLCSGLRRVSCSEGRGPFRSKSGKLVDNFSTGRSSVSEFLSKSGRLKKLIFDLYILNGFIYLGLLFGLAYNRIV